MPGAFSVSLEGVTEKKYWGDRSLRSCCKHSQESQSHCYSVKRGLFPLVALSPGTHMWPFPHPSQPSPVSQISWPTILTWPYPLSNHPVSDLGQMWSQALPKLLPFSPSCLGLQYLGRAEGGLLGWAQSVLTLRRVSGWPPPPECKRKACAAQSFQRILLPFICSQHLSDPAPCGAQQRLEI